MQNECDWKSFSGSNVVGGRPSKIGVIVRMDLSEFYAMAGDGSASKRAVARALVWWLGKQGKRVSERTAMRVINALIKSGAMVQTPAVSPGMGSKVYPAKKI